jgi:hypothetical protein
LGQCANSNTTKESLFSVKAVFASSVDRRLGDFRDCFVLVESRSRPDSRPIVFQKKDSLMHGLQQWLKRARFMPMRNGIRFIASLVLCVAATACSGGADGADGPTALVDPASGATCGQGADVRITHSGFSTVLNGQCRSVIVTGSNGSVNVDHAQSIRVEGQRVTVLNEKVETLEAFGSDNSFNMTEVGHAIVAGDRNTLLGRAYQRVTFKGKDNAVNTDNDPDLDDQGTGNKVI